MRNVRLIKFNFDISKFLIFPDELLLAFSLKKNLCSMFSTEKKPNEIEAAHFVRWLNAFMLIFAHKSMALFFVPYVNRTAMSEVSKI